MFGSGRSIGFVILSSAVLLACGGTVGSTALSLVSPLSNTRNLLFGSSLSLLVATPLMGIGAFFFWRGKRTLRELTIIRHQKTLLHMLKHHGYIKIDELSSILGKSSAYVQYLVHDLAEKDLLHGYFNQIEGIFYPTCSGSLQALTACPICSDKQDFTGKQTIQCQNCRAQFFL